MVNKYGNDFENNIFFFNDYSKDYIKEITIDGITYKEGQYCYITHRDLNKIAKAKIIKIRSNGNLICYNYLFSKPPITFSYFIAKDHNRHNLKLANEDFNMVDFDFNKEHFANVFEQFEMMASET